MCFYATVDNIRQKLSGYLEALAHAAGHDTRRISEEYKALYVNAKDAYSAGLLRRGVSNNQACLFSNEPHTCEYLWILGNDLEKVFAVMGLPTTQAQAYKLSNELNRKGVEGALTKEQLNALRGFSAIHEHTEKVAKWCHDAREVIELVKGNLSLLETVTEEEREFAKSLNFDWHYSYSDDRNVYRAGREAHDRVSLHVCQVLAEKPHLRHVVETVAAGGGLSVAFFIGR